MSFPPLSDIDFKNKMALSELPLMAGDPRKSMRLNYHRFHKSYFIQEYSITTCKPFYLYGIPYLLGMDSILSLDGAKKSFTTRWRILKSAIFRNRVVCGWPDLRLKMCYFDKPSQISKYNQHYFRWGSTTVKGTIMVRHHRKKRSLEVTIMVQRSWCAAIMVRRDHR